MRANQLQDNEHLEDLWGAADNQANVSPSQVESVEVPLLPLPVQRRMAAILSADLIENDTRLLLPRLISGALDVSRLEIET